MALNLADLNTVQEIFRAVGPDLVKAVAEAVRKDQDVALAKALRPLVDAQAKVDAALKGVADAICELAAQLAPDGDDRPSPIREVLGELQRLNEGLDRQAGEIAAGLKAIEEALR